MFGNHFIHLTLSLMVLTAMASTSTAQDEKASADKELGYFLGFTVGQSFAQQGFKDGDFSQESMLKGLTDALGGEAPSLTSEQVQAVQGRIQAMLQKRQAAQQAEMAQQAIANKEKSEVWLEKNKTEAGIKELESGVQYKVLTEGEGGSPTATDTVKVHYTGKLISGEVFDSSVERGEPAEFTVGGVIQGWQKALVKMKVGSKWMLYIPPGLAYGERGSAPRIGPNETLIFEVELLEIL